MQKVLLEIYDRLLTQHGPQDWWPAEEPFEVMIGAILTQSAAWRNVEKAIAKLKAQKALSPRGLRQTPTERIGRLIYPSGYYNAKAVKIKALVDWLGREYDDDLDKLFTLDIDSLRRELLLVHGIGEETADSIILYAARKPIFVIDAYTRRILTRLGLRPARGDYAAFQELFMKHLPHSEELFNEYHALLVRQGKETCKRVPRCDQCCLGSLCEFPHTSREESVSR